MQNRTLRQLTAAGVIAAAYAALSLALAPISFGAVQCRVAEVLTLLPVISPAAIWGVGLGCAITNAVGAATGANFLGLVDLFVGTAATLLAALASRLLGRIRTGGLQIAAARQVVQGRAGDALHSDVVVVVAAGLLGVVGRRGGMVQGHAGDDADLVARLLGIFGDELKGRGEGHVVIDDAGKRLFAGGHRSRGGSRIRTEGGRIVGGNQAQRLKAREAQIRRNREFTLRIFDRAEVILRRSHLRVAHAVADEHEYVLGGARFFLRQRARKRAYEHQHCEQDGKILFHFLHSPFFWDRVECTMTASKHRQSIAKCV